MSERMTAERRAELWRWSKAERAEASLASQMTGALLEELMAEIEALIAENAELKREMRAPLGMEIFKVESGK